MASCSIVRRRRTTGIVTLSASGGNALGLAVVAGPGGCRERTSEKDVSAVEQ